MIRSSTMIVRITILRLNRKTVTRSTEKAKNIAQIQSSKWECSWMEMIFHLLLSLFPGNANEQTSLRRLETKYFRISDVPNLFIVVMHSGSEA